MESIYGNSSSSKGLKRNSLSGNVSPIRAFIEQNLYYHSPKSPIFDPYAYSDDASPENSDSSLIKYLRSAAIIQSHYRDSVGNSSGSNLGSRGGLSSSSSRPLFSAIDSMGMSPTRSRLPSLFWNPMEEEEDVLVMDGILVRSAAGARMKCLSLSNSSGSSSSGTKSSNRKELCRSWEDSGNCRYGAKCQFAHGKENLRPTRLSHKSKSEFCKIYTGPGSCSYGSNCRFLHYESSATPSPSAILTTQTISPIKLQQPSSSTMIISKNDWAPQSPSMTASQSEMLTITRTSSPVKQHPHSGSMITRNKDCEPLDLSIAASPPATSTMTQAIIPIKLEYPSSSTMITASTKWSPVDDGIEVNLPSSASADKVPTWEEVDDYINSILYRPTGRKRLPVFVEICPE